MENLSVAQTVGCHFSYCITEASAFDYVAHIACSSTYDSTQLNSSRLASLLMA